MRTLAHTADNVRILSRRSVPPYLPSGIAVGNAKEGLKAIADEVCDDIAEDGIYKTMKKYQLI